MFKMFQIKKKQERIQLVQQLKMGGKTNPVVYFSRKVLQDVLRWTFICCCVIRCHNLTFDCQTFIVFAKDKRIFNVYIYEPPHKQTLDSYDENAGCEGIFHDVAIN